MKKLIMFALVAVAGLLFFTATPVSAQENIAVTADPGSVPADAGEYTVTINGTGWVGAPAGLFVTVCTGAEGGDVGNIGEADALTACPTLVVDAGKATADADGNWSVDVTITVDDTAIANGSVAVLAGELAAGTSWSGGVNVLVGDDSEGDAMADTGAESGMLAVIGASVLVAGLLALGLGRRLSSRS